jgi:Flp pilus assembly protein TadD
LLTVPTPQAAAIEILRRIIEANPADLGAWTDLGRELRLAGDLEGAEAAFRRAIALDPKAFPPLLGLGLTLKAQGRLAETAEAVRRAIRADPTSADAFNNLGNVLGALGRSTPALMAYRAALRRDPNHAEAWSNLGVLLRKLGRSQESLGAFERAAGLRPGSATAHFNLAGALAAEERAGADQAYRRAIALKPDWVSAHFNYAAWLLREGRLREGFAEYEWRGQRPHFKALGARLPHPLWRGQPVDGKVVLATAEQGLGDTIQCARFLPRLARLGATVLVEAKPATRDLLLTVEGVAGVVEPGDRIDRLDFQTSLFSLPHAFGVELDTIPAEVPYLHPPEALVAHWNGALPTGARRIGLVWQGNPTAKMDKGRSFPLAAMRPLFAVKDAAFVCLQRDHGLDQFDADPPFPIARLGPAYDTGSLLDTAAVIANLDLVITCDTAVAHLAGALGKPVWIALKSPAEWRWLRGRADSPWYPSARLYRQANAGDWASVFAAMTQNLAAA